MTKWQEPHSRDTKKIELIGLGDIQVVMSGWKARVKNDVRVTGLCNWVDG